MKPGKESTEHARASRAEAAAFIVLAAGLVLALLGASRAPVVAAVGVVLVAVGAALLASVVRSYSGARGDVKAAAERPRVVQAPK